MTSRGISRYLDDFRRQLAGMDRAIVQDALSDAEDHLTSALETYVTEHPGVSPEEAVNQVIESYGSPGEIAEQYRRIEEYTSPAIGSTRPRVEKRGLRGFFGVIAEPSAWAAMLYMIFGLATGIVYFTWTTAALSVSAGLIVLVIGVPVTWLFFLSFRGLALVEGRIVEALLGVRMPRRPVFVRKGEGWWGSLKGVFATGSTWTSLVYLILMLPLGVLYFSLFVTLFALSLSMIASPVLELVFHIQVFDLYESWWIPVWLMPFVVIAGALLFPGTLHLARSVGRLHGRLARTMLVSGS
ncbi:sensor domain-containing protein [Candidatus Fermentibacterales bacterium]|nr:sensor domain-containing protein [Candidatus Fermentibacterales bacterium]